MSIRTAVFASLFSIVFLQSFKSPAIEIEADIITHVSVLSVDRRPTKDLLYSMCVGYVSNNALDTFFHFATPLIGDRACPGPEALKFNYKAASIESEGGKVSSYSMSDYGLPRTANYQGKTWVFSMLPDVITVNIPSHSAPGKVIKDSFCLASLRTGNDYEDEGDSLLIACDDCSSIQKCFDTKLPTTKPLTINGKKVEPDTLLRNPKMSSSVNIKPHALYHPRFVTLDRQHQKNLLYSKCVGLFWHEELKETFLMATTPVGERECPGIDELKFNFSRRNRFWHPYDKGARVSTDDGKIFAERVPVDNFPGKIDLWRKKWKKWELNLYPRKITSKVPDPSDPNKLIEDSFCIAYLRTQGTVGEGTEFELIACDDCSSLNKCEDTEIYTEKPLTVGGKKLEGSSEKKR